VTDPLLLDVDSTRGAHFKALIGSGTYVVTAAVLATIAFGIGAAEHSVAVIVGGPSLVALATAAYAWYRADQQSENEFFTRFAAAHKMNLWPKYSLYELTPLLAGGDRRHCANWMEAGQRGLGWFTFEVRHDNGDKQDTWTSYDFTLATVDVGEQGMSHFAGIYLRRRRGMLDHLSTDSDWLRGNHLKKVELESTAFCERYELWAESDQNDLVLRELFSPSFIVWLANHPLEPGFELRAGQLVVFITGHCGEQGKLEFLLMAADEISKRIQAELTEAAQAGRL
jgi:hypothetical protein